MRPFRSAATLAVAALLLSACGGSETPADDVGDLPVTEPDASGDEAGSPLPDDAADEDAVSDDGGASGSDPLLGPEIEIAMTDLIERADVERADILIEVTELVTWPNGALGCPEADGMYTQALVDGYRIVMSAAGSEYHYHGASGEDPAYCAEPTPPAS
ncbi:MAG: hypothetical protein WD670_03975 [Actinomycetota bacterium]